MNPLVEQIKSSREYFENFITRSTYNSNRIEGNTLSFAETYALLFNDNSFKVSASPREIYEAINHKYALNFVFDHLEEELHLDFLTTLAQLVNRNIREIDGLRKDQVYIRGANFIPPPPSQVYTKMIYFIQNYNHTDFGPFEKAARFHIDFEHIHPFEDGNGRVGRLLINYEMLRNGLPPIVIPAEERADYFTMLQEENIPALTLYLAGCSEKEKAMMEKYGLYRTTDRPNRPTLDR